MANLNLVDAVGRQDAMAEAPRKKKWIKGATEGAHGQFAAKAKAAGETTREFAAEKSGAPGKLGQEARLAKTLMGMHHDGAKPKRRTAKEQRHALYGKE